MKQLFDYNDFKYWCLTEARIELNTAQMEALAEQLHRPLDELIELTGVDKPRTKAEEDLLDRVMEFTRKCDEIRADLRRETGYPN